MPRPLALGNGRLLVQIDSRGRIRDFFWPEIGIRNHVGGHFFHTGIFEAGRFSWLEWEEWDIQQSFDAATREGTSVHECSSMGLSITCTDAVQGDSFVRGIEILNLSDRSRQLELFFSQDFRIAESEIGDTAFYHPGLDAMVHFKWGYCFACTGRSSESGICQRTVGIRGIHGLQGTWRDAEDGILEEKPIEQGAIDSTFSVRLTCPAHGFARAQYEIACLPRVPTINTPFPWAKGNQSATRFPNLSELPVEVRTLAEQSIPLMLSQIASNGAILAANDSDIMQSNRANYSYIWPRDGALVAVVLDRLGLHVHSAAYHRFALSLISQDQPFFLQKYSADGTLGATWHPWMFEGRAELPLQEDETALTLWSVWRHIEMTGDDSLLEEFYASAILPMAGFLCAHVDDATCLPKPSYDLWEERRGIHAFTVATVVAGLAAASRLAASRKDPRKVQFTRAAVEVRKALLSHLVDRQNGRFARSANVSESELRLDQTPDASLLLVRRFAGLDLDDKHFAATRSHVERSLWVHSPVSGLARYTADYYSRVSDAFPGNPWVITTMWLAQEQISSAKTPDQLETPLRLLQWAVDRADSTGVLGEQFHPETGETLTVSPLTWSHAEYLSTCLDWVEKSRELTART